MNKAVTLMNVPELAELLFHGSIVRVRDIDLSMGAVKKDFGRGFYTTAVRIQAEKFAQIKAHRENIPGGWVSVFEYVHNPEVIGTYGDPASPAAKDTAIRLLDTSKLYNQVFFGTGRAVSCLKYKESYPVGTN
jgi:hypothetical protein